MQPGMVFENRFDLSHVLGSGGFGDVWAAKDRQTGGEVALKVIPCAASSRAWQRGLVAAETAALARLRHPHIVTLHESVVTDDRIIMVMERVSGTTLAADLGGRAAHGRHYTSAEVVELLGHLTDAIEAAHDNGVLHRDLKPANVMVLPGAPHLKLLDFGIARLAEQSRSEATTAGRLLGTFTQLAPEVIRGEEVDVRVDVFGLGCLMFEILTLRHPWIVTAAGHGQRGLAGGIRTPKVYDELFERIVRGARPSVSAYNAVYGPAVDAVIQRALASLPHERHETVRALQSALLGALQLRESQPAPDVTPVALRPPALAMAAPSLPPVSRTEPDPVWPHTAFGISDQVELRSDALDVGALDAADAMRTDQDLETAEYGGGDAMIDAPQPPEPIAPTAEPKAPEPSSAVIEIPVTRLPPDGDAVLRARAALAPPRAPSMAEVWLQPSVAVALRLKPSWVKFSALSDHGVALPASSDGPPAVPEARLPPAGLYGWLALGLALLALLTGLTQGWLQGLGLGLGAIAAAAAHAVAWRSHAGHRTTRRLMAALRADERFRWTQHTPTAAGLSARGELAEARSGARVTVFLPTAPFLAGSYRVGFTLRLEAPIAGDRRMSVAQIIEAMKDPDMAPKNELVFPLMYHLKRRQPSLVELSAREVRLSVAVSRGGVDDALDDISTSMLAASVMLQWMDDCLNYGDVSGDPR